jgi:hypothetical protein
MRGKVLLQSSIEEVIHFAFSVSSRATCFGINVCDFSSNYELRSGLSFFYSLFNAGPLQYCFMQSC